MQDMILVRAQLMSRSSPDRVTAIHAHVPFLDPSLHRAYKLQPASCLALQQESEARGVCNSATKLVSSSDPKATMYHLDTGTVQICLFLTNYCTELISNYKYNQPQVFSQATAGKCGEGRLQLCHHFNFRLSATHHMPC